MSALVLQSRSQTRRKVWVAGLALAALFALLFQYRILSLLKRMGADVAPIGTRLPITLDFQSAPPWLLPLYYTLDYLNLVWFTTLLGLFIAGAAIAFLSGFLRGHLGGNGLGQHLAATLLGLPNMFCTCCAASTLDGLRKAGAGLGPSLAFFVTAPALNLVVILLAFQMLPLKLAIARSVLGVAAAIGVTYAVARLFPGVAAEPLERLPAGPDQESVAGMLRSWLRHTWDVSRSVIPLLALGIFAVSVFKTILPFEAVVGYFGEGAVPTLLAAAIGTILMVPTFTEVLWVQELTRQGMGIGPAAALLITLPAVSFPSLWVLGRTFRSYRLAASLGSAILLLGAIGGALFAAI